MSDCVWPGAAWSTGDPKDHGVSAAALRAIGDGVMGDAAVIRHGVEVYTYGSPGARTEWASVARSFLTTQWGMLIAQGRIPGGMAALDMPVRDLGTATARKFGAGVRLKHLLSYTSCASPPGSKWRYSCGDHWPMQHQILEELTGETVQRWMGRELLDVLGGGMSCKKKDDGTNRVYGSPRALARWGYLWLRGGLWRDRQLLAPAFVRRATAGGPAGTGKPWPLEGYQIHLVKGERITGDKQGDEVRCPGVPDGTFFAYGSFDKAVVAVVPALDLVVGRRRSHGYGVETWLGQVCRACRR